VNEEALAHWGLSRQKKKKQILDFLQWENVLAYQSEYTTLKSVFCSYGGGVKECSN
jgi:hypothetical protein